MGDETVRSSGIEFPEILQYLLNYAPTCHHVHPTIETSNLALRWLADRWLDGGHARDGLDAGWLQAKLEGRETKESPNITRRRHRGVRPSAEYRLIAG